MDAFFQFLRDNPQAVMTTLFTTFFTTQAISLVYSRRLAKKSLEERTAKGATISDEEKQITKDLMSYTTWMPVFSVVFYTITVLVVMVLTGIIGG